VVLLLLLALVSPMGLVCVTSPVLQWGLVCPLQVCRWVRQAVCPLVPLAVCLLVPPVVCPLVLLVVCPPAQPLVLVGQVWPQLWPP
jgi:hypothetical protein